MQLSPPVKTVLALALVVGAVGYGLLVEFAVNAGRVHPGVTVEGFDIGGLNRTEAEAALSARGEEMKNSPMVFTGEGFDCRFTPEQVGWGPQEFETTNAAMAVGRRGSWIDAVRERIRAWTEGVEVEWADAPDPAKVGRELNRCEDLATSMGVGIDRERLRYKIKRTIVTWPRRPTPIPLDE